MKKVRLVTVGKCREAYFTDALAEYAKRLSRYADFETVEYKESRTEDVEEEADAILRACRGYVVLFDLTGKQIASEELAALLDGAYGRADTVSFVIGSSRGVSERVRERADARIAFGRATFPHQLFRVMAAEQIYRAFTVLNNVPYHK